MQDPHPPHLKRQHPIHLQPSIRKFYTKTLSFLNAPFQIWTSPSLPQVANLSLKKCANSAFRSDRQYDFLTLRMLNRNSQPREQNAPESEQPFPRSKFSYSVNSKCQLESQICCLFRWLNKSSFGRIRQCIGKHAICNCEINQWSRKFGKSGKIHREFGWKKLPKIASPPCLLTSIFDHP